jgi:hypothetical protein
MITDLFTSLPVASATDVQHSRANAKYQNPNRSTAFSLDDSINPEKSAIQTDLSPSPQVR